MAPVLHPPEGWQWDVSKAHLAYTILGGFTMIFSLVSLFIKEKLYIGEATVATIVGIIFGPHALNLFNPASWGNVDLITLEASRIVLIIQVFAVGVELPPRYMQKHARSVLMLLIPIMIVGWLVSSVFIYALIRPLSWVDSLVVGACVTATDPVLASSVVGKGKFAKRVPGHLRNLLSAESGSNDGMAFPFLYLALELTLKHSVGEALKDWFLLSVLYEIVLSVVAGALLGILGRKAIKLAERKNLIDRESFIVFYIVLALFSTGCGTLLGSDDLLMAFAAGAAFSWDGSYGKATEDSKFSSVIDLLLNLSFFVYFGAVVPWEYYNRADLGLSPWRLVVVAILILLFRRIPGILALKSLIPDIRTWREALFCGHFGPIGVGGIFIAILARSELESETAQPSAELPTDVTTPNYGLILSIWPIVSFMVIASIVVHGSSIFVFTLGKKINSIQMQLSLTHDNENSSNWMSRLPRIEVSTSASRSRADSIGPTSRRGSKDLGRSKSKDSLRKSRTKEKDGAGGPVDPSAYGHDFMREFQEKHKGQIPDFDKDHEMYQEGKDIIVEDKDGEVIARIETNHDQSAGIWHRLLKDEVLANTSPNEKLQIARNPAHPLYQKMRAFVKSAGGMADSLDSHPEKDEQPDEKEEEKDESQESSHEKTPANEESDSDNDETDNRERGGIMPTVESEARAREQRSGETAVERRRRLAALGIPDSNESSGEGSSKDSNSDENDNDIEMKKKESSSSTTAPTSASTNLPSIRFGRTTVDHGEVPSHLNKKNGKGKLKD